MIEYSLKPVQDLISGKINTLAEFEPNIRHENPLKTNRHTPLIVIDSPWPEGGILSLEVPEYSWARVPGDKHSNDPFYYGRPIVANKQWTVRYPSLEKPEWVARPGGGLELSNPLEGGFIQHFQVIPRNRMIECRFGITNNSQKPLTDLRCQLCARSHQLPGFEKRWPTRAFMYSDKEVVNWAGAGQDLSWLNEYYNEGNERFAKSCFFLSPLKGHEPQEYLEKKLRYGMVMWLDRTVDIPAIAKQNTSNENQYIVVYSPFGRNAFYNCLTPCFHADPLMDRIDPGETRWTVSYFMFFEGELRTLYKGLAKLHPELQRTEGILTEQENAE